MQLFNLQQVPLLTQAFPFLKKCFIWPFQLTLKQHRESDKPFPNAPLVRLLGYMDCCKLCSAEAFTNDFPPKNPCLPPSVVSLVAPETSCFTDANQFDDQYMSTDASDVST